MRLGISLYPYLIAENYDLEAYLTKYAKAQIKVIFTTLIKVKKRDQKLFNRFYGSVAYKRVLFNLIKNKKLFSFIKI